MNAKLDQREAAKSENPNARTGTEKRHLDRSSGKYGKQSW